MLVIWKWKTPSAKVGLIDDALDEQHLFWLQQNGYLTCAGRSGCRTYNAAANLSAIFPNPGLSGCNSLSHSLDVKVP